MQGLHRLGLRKPILPLGVQLIGLLVAALAAAQLVTLALTVLIPPAPQQRWNLGDVARALTGGKLASNLERRTMRGPPDLAGAGWLVSTSSREALAKAVDRPVGDVELAFFTQLPVGGTAIPLGMDKPRSALGFQLAIFGAAHAQAGPGGPPPGGMPGGAMPGGGFPGGMPPGGRPPTGLPPSGAMPGGGPMGGQVGVATGGLPPAGTSAPSAGRQPPPVAGPISGGPNPGRSLPGGPAVSQPPPPPPPPAMGLAGAFPETPRRAALPSLRDPERAPERASDEPIAVRPAAGPNEITAAAPEALGVLPAAAPPPPAVTRRVGEVPQPLPFRRDTGLLAFTTPPFIEGDFVAAMRLGDGRWIVVAPRAEGFPNAWQRRVALWFLLSLLLVAPAAWFFAKRIVRPLQEFAKAAEHLGRDPAATIMPLSGPAEIGRAADAFNQMRNRLRAFVDDRTAMVGAISHDLRTPLTRLRFRIEDVPDDQRDGLLGEVEEMEQLISQVVVFIRDASTPGARENLDLAALARQAAEGFVMIGEPVELGEVGSAPVSVDPVGMRRLLANLLENALKYGGAAQLCVTRRQGIALVEVIDKGPGIPSEEMEQAFAPFFRGESARRSDKQGSGLGLAVCRSIARAHGGDVTFEHRSEGFVARLSLPLAFDEAA